MNENLESVVIGGGCFWCVEAVFERIEGVQEVVSGYMGGELPDPTYEAVCTGRTGHAEVVKVTFDPEVVPLAAILEWFFATHDPTTLNRQGGDTGTQYRSVIFYANEQQKGTAEALIEKLQSRFAAPIVTELSAATEFYRAEAYHQGYYSNNSSAMYCQMVIAPKLRKVQGPGTKL